MQLRGKAPPASGHSKERGRLLGENVANPSRAVTGDKRNNLRLSFLKPTKERTVSAKRNAPGPALVAEGGITNGEENEQIQRQEGHHRRTQV